MQRLPRRGLFLLGWMAGAAIGCGGSADDASFGGRDTPQPPGGTSGGGGAGGTSGGGNAGSGNTADASRPPPETEVEKAFEAPVATERFVWATNPRTGRVALIDGTTFQVKTVAAGQAPTYIAALPGQGDRAIVINVVSNDVTFLAQRTDGTLEQRTYQIAPRANAWAISPDGRFAIAWTDVTRVQRPDVIEGFQQISIIDLEDVDAPARVPVRTVGFRPSSLSFASNPPRAFAVTEDGITVLDLSTARDPKVLRTLPLDAAPTLASFQDAGADGDFDGTVDDADTADADAGALDASDGGAIDAHSGDAPGDALEPIDVVIDVATDTRDAGAIDVAIGDRALTDVRSPDTSSDAGPPPPQTGKADVSITPDGAFAIFRREGSAIVTVVDLADGSRWSWTLSGPVTDLDLADTGSRAVAVVRNESRIAVLPVPGRGPASFDDVLVSSETVGSVAIAPRGTHALLYSNAVAVNRITVLDMSATPKYRAVALHAPVLSVFPTPTAEHAIVVHNNFKGQAFQSAGAFSVMPLAGSQTPVIQATDAPVLSVAVSPTGDRAIVAVRDDVKKIYAVYLANMPSLVVDRYALATPPVAAGFVGAEGYAFVAQEHPGGRVSFIDAKAEQVRTITGFELGAGVVEWTKKDGGK
jgi:hypothetical protein